MSSEKQDKPWRPADYPRPGPSWHEPDPDDLPPEHESNLKIGEG